MWCVPELNDEYIERMEDILATYEKPLDFREPVVCIDEKPLQLLKNINSIAAKLCSVFLQPLEFLFTPFKKKNSRFFFKYSLVFIF